MDQVDALRRKANEGTLTPVEDAQYKDLVEAIYRGVETDAPVRDETGAASDDRDELTTYIELTQIPITRSSRSDKR